MNGGPEPVAYLDVADKSELPTPALGYRYLDFLGGSLHLRCYLVPEEMPRFAFVARNEHLLDDALRPVYRSDAVIVSQDASYALPGFYIVSLTRHFRAFDEMDMLTYLRTQLVLRHVRAAMRAALGVTQIHLHYEEKPDPSTNVHYWLVPLDYQAAIPATVLTRLELRRYLSQFRFSRERENILLANQRMRHQLTEAGTASAESEFVRRWEWLAEPA